MFDDDFEIIEDDSASTSPSNFSNRNKTPNLGVNSNKNIQETVEKNKSNMPNNATPKGGIDNGNQFKNAGNVANMTSGLNSNDPNQQKQALKNLGKQEIKPMARKAVQAATGGAVGTDPFTGKMIDKAVDKVAESPQVDEMLNKVVDTVQKARKAKKILLFFQIAGPFIGWFFVFILFFTAIMSPIANAQDFVESSGGFFSKLGNFLIGNGWCATEGECQLLYESKYYQAIDDFDAKYNSICDIDWNSDLISATIFYEQMMVSNEVGIEDNESSDEEPEENLSESVNSLYNYENADKKVGPLTSRLYPNLNNTNLNTSQRCQADYQGYRLYLRSYINDNFKELKKPEYSEYTDEIIMEEILAFGNEIIIGNAYRGSYYCSGVTVVDTEGNTIGSYDLEDYVAGVVQAESYTDIAGMEALKAQAILARTFVLDQTNNCKTSIESSQNKQVFVEPISGGVAEQAALETEGMILQYGSDLTQVQYDSFCYDDEDCPDTYCTDTECYATYTKLPNGEKHTVTVPIKWKPYFVSGGGHATGLSQLASYAMAEDGKIYDEILLSFYSPGVEIAMMTGLLQGAIYTSTSPPPLNPEQIQQRASTNTDLFYNNSMGLVSQCPWYAKSRAAEILYYSDIPEDIKQAAITSISNTGGDGGNVVSRVDEELFVKSYDYTQPHPGSIVSWTSRASDGPNCHNYGHVAIIEQVNDDGTVVISDGWNGGGVHASNTWQNIRYRLRDRVPLSEVAQYKNSSGCTYTFAGYVYLLG